MNLGDLGSPGEVDLVAFELSDLTGSERTFAGLLACAFMDGYDPTVLDFLTVPIPEPSTALLLATGLAGLAATGRRRPS